MSRPLPKVVVRIGNALIALFFVGLGILITTLTLIDTDWLKDKVRQRIVAELEKSTGGRVEIGSFKWHNLTAEAAPLIVHGNEPAGAPPLFRAAKIEIGVKIVSFVNQQVNIASLTVEKPEIHVYLNADGTTNLPKPKGARGQMVSRILYLRIQQLTAANGFAEYNSKHVPLDFRAENLAANVRYFPSPARHTAEFSSHQFHITTPEVRHAAFDLEARLTVQNHKVQIQSASLSLNRSTIQVAGTVAAFSSIPATL